MGKIKSYFKKLFQTVSVCLHGASNADQFQIVEDLIEMKSYFTASTRFHTTKSKEISVIIFTINL